MTLSVETLCTVMVFHQHQWDVSFYKFYRVYCVECGWKIQSHNSKKMIPGLCRNQVSLSTDETHCQQWPGRNPYWEPGNILSSVRNFKSASCTTTLRILLKVGRIDMSLYNAASLGFLLFLLNTGWTIASLKMSGNIPVLKLMLQILAIGLAKTLIPFLEFLLEFHLHQ